MTFAVPNLRALTLDLLSQVPEGKITTFRAVAHALGDVIASRAVGQILAEHEMCAEIPTHRVVYRDGKIGGTREIGSQSTKIELLRSEGVPIDGWKVQNFEHYLYESFKSEKPLINLREIQREVANWVVQGPITGLFRTAGGVDLSYKNSWSGVGAYVGVEIETQIVQVIETARHEINFPYIPSYLAFRELPVLLLLLGKIQREKKIADVVFVDGSGILHPRHVGIASHLGVLLDVSTIGVTKSKLYGSVAIRGMRAGEVRSIIEPENGKEIGAAVKTTERAAPIYVSVGHGIDLESAIDLVLKLSQQRLPLPIHLAHKTSGEAARQAGMTPSQQAFGL